MSYSGDDTHLANARRGSSASCKPLLDVATPELFRTNAFRITGLHVDATTREIAKHTDKLKMMEELGQGKSVHTGAFALKTPPSVDQIREAIQRLKEPEQRIIDEFFWFWPREFGQSAMDPAIMALESGDADTALEIWELLETNPKEGVIAVHNIAVLWQCMALEWERHYAKESKFTKEQRAEVDKLWRGSFKRWELLAVDDLFWAKVSARIKDLDDPRLTTGFARRMRATLPQALDKINAELALRYAESGDLASARTHVAFMRESNAGIDDIAATVELVLAPATARLKQQMERAKERVGMNVSETPSVVRELLDSAREAFRIFDLFLGKNSEIADDLSDEIAILCNHLQIPHHKSNGDDKGCFDLLALILPFAKSSDTKKQIEKNLEVLKSNLAFKRMEPVHKILKGIQDSVALPSGRLESFKSKAVPAIATVAHGFEISDAFSDLCDSAAIVLREIGLSAWNEHQDLTTAVSANSMAIRYVRDKQLRDRLSQDTKTLREMEVQRAEAQVAKEKEEKATRNRWLAGIAIFIFFVIVNNADSGKSKSGTTTSAYHPPSTTPVPVPYVPKKIKDPYEGIGVPDLKPSPVRPNLQSAEDFLGGKPMPSPTPSLKPTTQRREIDLKSESAQAAQRKAIAIYPELAVSDSPLNKLFIAKVNRMKLNLSGSFSDPDWAIKVAAECKRELEGKSTYLVPDSRTLELNLDRSQIDTAKSAVSILSIRIGNLNSDLDDERASLDRTNRYAVERFNRKLEGYNALTEQFKAQQDSVNRLVEAYNEKLRRYGR